MIGERGKDYFVRLDIRSKPSPEEWERKDGGAGRKWGHDPLLFAQRSRAPRNAKHCAMHELSFLLHRQRKKVTPMRKTEPNSTRTLRSQNRSSNQRNHLSTFTIRRMTNSPREQRASAVREASERFPPRNVNRKMEAATTEFNAL